MLKKIIECTDNDTDEIMTSDPHRTFGLPLDHSTARKSQFLDMFTCNGFW